MIERDREYTAASLHDCVIIWWRNHTAFLGDVTSAAVICQRMRQTKAMRPLSRIQTVTKCTRRWPVSTYFALKMLEMILENRKTI